MSLARAGRSSWAGLGLWLSYAALALLIACVMVVGPELADRAWDRGIHVTPAQAAMHAALLARGFTHHHHTAAPGRQVAATPSDGAIAQSGTPTLTWGTPFVQTVQPEHPPTVTLTTGAVPPDHQPVPAGPDLRPSTPPPEDASPVRFPYVHHS